MKTETAQPFTSVEHVVVDVVNNVRIVHVERSSSVIEDYYRYANLIIYKALHHLQSGDRESAIKELERLESLWDGRGFADAYYQVNRRYEAYKLALAVYAYRALGLGDKAERYEARLLSITPYTTLYRDSAGEGDLNLETAVITLLALYSTQKPIHNTTLVVVIVVLVVVVVAVSIMLALRLLLLKHYIHSRTHRHSL